jgi:hypothetical protein
LGGTQIDDQGLAHLRDLENLRALDLQSTPIRGPGLVHLTKLKGLESLHLPRTQVDDQSLAALSGLTHLRQLDLGNTKVKGPGLAHLSGCRHLYSLSLNNLSLTDLSAIAELDRLHAISFGHTKSHRRNCIRFGNGTVGYVGLDDPMYTDEHLAALSDADQVRKVYLTRWQRRVSEDPGTWTMDRLESLTLNGSIGEEEPAGSRRKCPELPLFEQSEQRLAPDP